MTLPPPHSGPDVPVPFRAIPTSPLNTLEDAIKLLRLAQRPGTSARDVVDERLAAEPDRAREAIYHLLRAVDCEWRGVAEIRRNFGNFHQPMGELETAAIALARVLTDRPDPTVNKE